MTSATLALAPLPRQPGPVPLPKPERRPLLVRTPAQQPGESPVGFILRASELNGYETPRRLFALAGAARDETFTVGLDMGKIAGLFGRDADHFRGYRERGESDASRVHLNGHPLAARDFDLSAPKICPECVQEHGFIPAWTDLDLMDACPTHARTFLAACPACGEKLSWFRPAVLRCQCGAVLDDARGAPISAQHAALLALVVAKASEGIGCGTSPAALNPCEMPVSQFDRMTLRGVLAMARSLARLDRVARQSRMAAASANDSATPASISARAGLLFSRWPENLFAVLRELVPSDAAAGRVVALRRHMEGLYRVILKDIAAAPDIAFLRETVGAFSRSFEANHGTTQEGFASSPDAPMQPPTAMSQPTGVPPPTASLSLPSAPRRKRASGKRQRIQPLYGARSFGLRGVARRLELPVSVLRYLRRVGHFEVRHKASRVVTFHEADIVAFEDKVRAFCAGASPLPTAATTTIEALTLGKALNMNFKFEDGKGELVAAIFDGTFPCFAGLSDFSLRGLVLDKDATLALIGRMRASAFGGAVTPAEASKTLYCDPMVIPSLVAAGYLVGQQHEAGLRVTRESVKTFAAEFCALAEVAKERGTSSRALQRYVATAGIEMLFFGRGYGRVPQPFIRRCDAEWT